MSLYHCSRCGNWVCPVCQRMPEQEPHLADCPLRAVATDNLPRLEPEPAPGRHHWLRDLLDRVGR